MVVVSTYPEKVNSAAAGDRDGPLTARIAAHPVQQADKQG